MSQAIAVAAFATDSHVTALNADLEATRGELARLRSRMASLALKLESQASVDSMSHTAGPTFASAAARSSSLEPRSTPRPSPHAPAPVSLGSPPLAGFAATAAKFALSCVPSGDRSRLQSQSSRGSGFVTRESENAAASAAELALLAMLSTTDQQRVAGLAAPASALSIPERFSSSSSDSDGEPRVQCEAIRARPPRGDPVSPMSPNSGEDLRRVPESALHGKSLLRLAEIRSVDITAANASHRRGAVEHTGSMMDGCTALDASAFGSFFSSSAAASEQQRPEAVLQTRPNDVRLDALVGAAQDPRRVLVRPRSLSVDQGSALWSSRASRTSSENGGPDAEEGDSAVRVTFMRPSLSSSVSIPGLWRTLTRNVRADGKRQGSSGRAPLVGVASGSGDGEHVKAGNRTQTMLSAMFGAMRIGRPSPLRSFSRAEVDASWSARPDFVTRVPVSSMVGEERPSDGNVTRSTAAEAAPSRRFRSASNPEAIGMRPAPDAFLNQAPNDVASSTAALTTPWGRMGDILGDASSAWRSSLRADAAAALAVVSPCAASNARRSDLVSFVTGLLKLSCGLQSFAIGSTPSRTYLPDSTIDILLVLPAKQQAPSADANPSDAGVWSTMAGPRPWFISVNDALCNAAAACHAAAKNARGSASVHSGGDGDRPRSRTETAGGRNRSPSGSSVNATSSAVDVSATASRLVSLLQGLAAAAGCVSATTRAPSASPQAPLSLISAVDAAAFGYLAALAEDSALLAAYIGALHAANDRIVKTLEARLKHPTVDVNSGLLERDVTFLREACVAAAVARALSESTAGRPDPAIPTPENLADSEYGALLLALAEGATADTDQRQRAGSDTTRDFAVPDGSPRVAPSPARAAAAAVATPQVIAAAVRAVLSGALPRGQPKWATAADGRNFSLRNVAFHVGTRWPDFRARCESRAYPQVIARPYVTCILDNVRLCIMASEQHMLPRLPASINRLKEVVSPHSAQDTATEAASDPATAFPLPIQAGAMSPCQELVRAAAFEDWVAALDGAASAARLVAEALPRLRPSSSSPPPAVDVALFTRRPCGDPLYSLPELPPEVERHHATDTSIAEAVAPPHPESPSLPVTVSPSFDPDHCSAISAMLPSVRHALVRVAPVGTSEYLYASAPPSRLCKQATILVAAWLRQEATGAASTSFVVSDSIAVAGLHESPPTDAARAENDAPLMLSLRCIELLVLTLFVEAAKCAALIACGSKSAVPAYASCLPRSGFFQHAGDVLASFVALFASVDFSSVVASPLWGLVPLHDYVAALEAPRDVSGEGGMPTSGVLYSLLEAAFVSECRDAYAQAIASTLVSMSPSASGQAGGGKTARPRLDSAVSVDSAESELQRARLRGQRRMEQSSLGSAPGSITPGGSESSGVGTVFGSPAGGRLKRVLDAETVARMSALTTFGGATGNSSPLLIASLRASAAIGRIAQSSGVPFDYFSGFMQGTQYSAHLPGDVIGGAVRVSSSLSNDRVSVAAVASLLEGTLQETLAAHLPHSLQAAGVAFVHADTLASAKLPWLRPAEALPCFFHAPMLAGLASSGKLTLAQPQEGIGMHVADILTPWVNACAGVSGAVPKALQSICARGCETMLRQAHDPARLSSVFPSLASIVPSASALRVQDFASVATAAIPLRPDMLHHPLQTRALQASTIAYAQEAMRADTLSSFGSCSDSGGPWLSSQALVHSAVTAAEQSVRHLKCAEAVQGLLRVRLPLLPPRGSGAHAAAAAVAAARASRPTCSATSPLKATPLEEDGDAASVATDYPLFSAVGAEIAPLFTLASASSHSDMLGPPWTKALRVGFAFSTPLGDADAAAGCRLSSDPLESPSELSAGVRSIIETLQSVHSGPRFFSSPFNPSPLDCDAVGMVVARDVTAAVSYGSFARRNLLALCVAVVGARGALFPSTLANAIKSEAGLSNVMAWFRGPYGGLPRFLSHYPHLFTGPGLSSVEPASCEGPVALTSHAWCVFTHATNLLFRSVTNMTSFAACFRLCTCLTL